MESRFDRGRQCAYKIVLDTVVTPGLVGLIAFGPLIVVLGLGICRGAKGQLVPVAVAADLPGYLVSLFFAFGDLAIDPTAWLLAGLVLGAAPATVDSLTTHSRFIQLVCLLTVLLASGGLGVPIERLLPLLKAAKLYPATKEAAEWRLRRCRSLIA